LDGHAAALLSQLVVATEQKASADQEQASGDGSTRAGHVSVLNPQAGCSVVPSVAVTLASSSPSQATARDPAAVTKVPARAAGMRGVPQPTAGEQRAAAHAAACQCRSWHHAYLRWHHDYTTWLQEFEAWRAWTVWASMA
jgi:hypothetical protein